MTAYEKLREDYGCDPTVAVWHEPRRGEWVAHLVGGNVTGTGATLQAAIAAMLQNTVAEAVEQIRKGSK